MAYTKLFSSIVTSTIWIENDQTRIVWITMLALSNKDGEVQGSIPGLARIAGVSLEACEKALETFLAPDKHSRTQIMEGRRIEIIDGGWQLINHAKYRQMASREDQKAQAAERQARSRRRHAKVTHRHGVVTQTLHIADTDTDPSKSAPAGRSLDEPPPVAAREGSKAPTHDTVEKLASKMRVNLDDCS